MLIIEIKEMDKFMVKNQTTLFKLSSNFFIYV